MENKTISVIIPVYNVDKFLDRCLQSVINNTYRNLEIICVNDGSTDHSIDILHRYKSIDERVIIIDKENGGLSSARNVGLDIAAGEYISFVDSDDWIHPQFFGILVYYLEKTGAQIAACNYVVTRKDHETEDVIDRDSVQYNVLKDDQVAVTNNQMFRGVWHYLYKKEIIGNIRFPDLQVEDLPFQIKVISFGNDNFSVCRIDCSLYYYYQRDNSLVRKFTPNTRLKMVQYFIDVLINCTHKNGHESGDRPE